MKKFLLSLFILFSFISVSASTGTNGGNIKIENIDVEVKENISYNDELSISYSINPRDAKNLKLVWNVTGIKKGITAEIVSGKNTSTYEGNIVIKVNNTLDEAVTLTLKAKQNGKVLCSTKLAVESKSQTTDRITKEVNELIGSLDEKINKDNYDENLKNVEKIDELLNNNSEIKDSIESELLKKYETVKESVNTFDANSNKTFVITVSIILVIIFLILIVWIFKKEDE